MADQGTESKADLVAIDQGTDSTVEFSNGNTLPLTARPFGHAHFGPETRSTDGSRWYDPRSSEFVGYRLTHQPSPWIGDYGWLRVGVDAPGASQLPQPLHPVPFSRDPSRGYRLSPFALAVPARCAAGEVLFELTPTERCALLRVTLPPAATTVRILVELPAASGRSCVTIDPTSRRVFGKSAHHSGGADAGFGCYFSLEVEGPVSATGVWSDSELTRGATAAPPLASAPTASPPELPHGHEANGDELWIGRVVRHGVPHAGKTRPAFGGLNYSDGGKAACVRDGYDVLRVCGGLYRWEAARDGDVPAGAVGVGAEGCGKYVARGPCGGGVHPGEAVAGVGCVVEYGGRGVTLSEYEARPAPVQTPNPFPPLDPLPDPLPSPAAAPAQTRVCAPSPRFSCSPTADGRSGSRAPAAACPTGGRPAREAAAREAARLAAARDSAGATRRSSAATSTSTSSRRRRAARR